MKITNRIIKELGFIEEDGINYLEILDHVMLSIHRNKPTNCYHFYINFNQPGALITSVEEIFTILSRHMINRGKLIKIDEFKKIINL